MKSLLSFKLMELPDLFYLWFYLLKYRHYIIDDGRWDSDEAGKRAFFLRKLLHTFMKGF